MSLYIPREQTFGTASRNNHHDTETGTKNEEHSKKMRPQLVILLALNVPSQENKKYLEKN
jgi:hypothetical protein